MWRARSAVQQTSLGLGAGHRTISRVQIRLAPPRISGCYTKTFYLDDLSCKPSVRFEEFRLRNSLERPRRYPLADVCRQQRANSPFGISVVRLREDDALANIRFCFVVGRGNTGGGAKRWRRKPRLGLGCLPLSSIYISSLAAAYRAMGWKSGTGRGRPTPAVTPSSMLHMPASQGSFAGTENGFAASTTNMISAVRSVLPLLNTSIGMSA